MTAIAIDPGTVGGLAVVDGGRLLGWAAWRRTRRRATPYDVAASTMRRVSTAPTLPYAIRSAAVHLPPELDLAGVPCAVEGIRPHGRKRGFVTLAESAGVAVAVLDGLVGAPLRPLPADWRPAVLGVPGTASGADAYALALWGWGPDPDAGSSRGTSRYPLGMGDGGDPPPAWARGHVADAACMAWWADEKK